MTGPINLAQMTDLMEDYALRLKASLPEEQQHILEAILLAKEIRDVTVPHKTKVANLRGASFRFKNKSIMLATMTDLCAQYLANPNLNPH